MKAQGITLFTILFILLISLCLFAQAPDTLWTKTYGGDSADIGYSALQTSDGGYIIIGGTHSFGAGDSDVWIIRTNDIGDTVWTKTYGTSDDDEGRSVSPTTDGGFFIVGQTYTFIPYRKKAAYLIKTDSFGDSLWTKAYVAMGDGRQGHSGEQTLDGGYIIGGSDSNKNGPVGLIFKTDQYGDSILWWDIWPGMGLPCEGHEVQQTGDDAYVITGREWQLATLRKYDTMGNSLWSKCYQAGMGYSFQQTSDSGYIIAGRRYYSNMNAYLIKTDAFGDTLWTRTYGGDSSDVVFSVKQTSDGGYIVAGNTRSFGEGGSDVWIIRANSSGDTLWTKTYGGTGDDGAHAIWRTTDGGYIVAGFTESFGTGNSDVWLLKIAPDVGVDEDENVPIMENKTTATIFSGPLHLPKERDCNVYNITGRKVDPNNIAPGIYLIEIDGKIEQKVVKVR
jgi:hypothetical protein